MSFWNAGICVIWDSFFGREHTMVISESLLFRYFWGFFVVYIDMGGCPDIEIDSDFVIPLIRPESTRSLSCSIEERFVDEIIGGGENSRSRSSR